PQGLLVSVQVGLEPVFPADSRNAGKNGRLRDSVGHKSCKRFHIARADFPNACICPCSSDSSAKASVQAITCWRSVVGPLCLSLLIASGNRWLVWKIFHRAPASTMLW